MTNEQLEKLESTLTSELKRARNDGILIGARVILSSVLEIINDTNLSEIKRNKKIRKYCENGLGKEAIAALDKVKEVTESEE